MWKEEAKAVLNYLYDIRDEVRDDIADLTVALDDDNEELALEIVLKINEVEL